MRLPARLQLQPSQTAALIAVPAAWGSMFPVIKALDLEAAPPPFALLNFAIHFVGAVALWGMQRRAAAAEEPQPAVVGRLDTDTAPPPLPADTAEAPAGRRRSRMRAGDGQRQLGSRPAAVRAGVRALARVVRIGQLQADRSRGDNQRQLQPPTGDKQRQLVAQPAAPSLLSVRLPARAAVAQPPLSVAWSELRAVLSAVELGALLCLAQAPMPSP